jgi:orotidine-5'-phosphate decarboxylase
MQVERLAIETERAGLSGLVSSAWELADLQRAVPTLFKVVPGIRMPDAAADDQARTLAPGAALGAGADALVIGRPIVEAKDPVKATEKILADLR